MKRLFSLFLLLVLLLSCTAFANGETHAASYIKASSSDRVHLRAGAGTSSESLGLYFTGTPVLTPYGSGQDGWTPVVIGSEKGYVHSDFLVSANADVPPRWKLAQVEASGWVNLRSAPTKEAPVLEKVTDGSIITVLGETSQKWCYVKSGSHFGYIMSRYLRVSSEEAPEPQPLLSSDSFRLPVDFYLSSGAGAWSTQMTILPDGSFWGYFYDADMGASGAGYPHGTLYECSFAGYFAGIQKISEYEYQLQVRSMQPFGIKGQEKIEDQTLVITAAPYGLSQNEIFSFYSSGIPEELLPEEALLSRTRYSFTEQIPSILYGHTSESAWLAE